LARDTAGPPTHDDKSTPLHEAADGGHSDVVQLLVGCGASRLSKRGYSASDRFKEEPVGTVRQIVEASEPDGSLSPIAAWLDRTAKWPAFRVVRTPLPTTRRTPNLL
jgi:hypothetical protein